MQAKPDQPPALINLSPLTESLIEKVKTIKKRPVLDENNRVIVSRTVSFFAIAYERIRNAVEYREEHLIRRGAIERILKRRLLLNPQGKGEAENLIRELLWARYFPESGLGVSDIDNVQALIDQYVYIRKKLTVGQISDKKVYLSQFLFDLLTCNIEETLDSAEAQRISLFVFYIYQKLKDTVKIENVDEERKNAYLYVAIEKGYAKSDRAYIRYHLFNLSHRVISSLKHQELDQMMSRFPLIFDKIDRIANNTYVEKLTKYVRVQMPPFLILFNTILRNLKDIGSIMIDKNKLWNQVDFVCREKYQQTSSRLRNLAIRSLIYIFLTKMVFALILEYPLSLYFYNEVNYSSIAINTLFPPLLMLLIVSFFRIPGEENTRRIYERIMNIVEEPDKEKAQKVAFILKPSKPKKPMLIFGFTLFYSLTFVITLMLIHTLLRLLNFNLVSEAIFIFFVSVVSFFGFRVNQITREYRVQTKESFFSPFIDFFFMPILSIGKFLSSEIARLNFFIVILDFLIEAPFKLIFEIIEEWISFVRARKEEIV